MRVPDGVGVAVGVGVATTAVRLEPGIANFVT
jgi:hypothetical protein